MPCKGTRILLVQNAALLEVVIAAHTCAHVCVRSCARVRVRVRVRVRMQAVTLFAFVFGGGGFGDLR